MMKKLTAILAMFGLFTSYALSAESTATGSRLYTDKNGDTAVIPEGFSVSEKSNERAVRTGLVVVADDKSEYVWIPVNEERFSRHNFGFVFAASFSRFRDETELESYRQMNESVLAHGGFYLARYEVSRSDGNTPLSVRVKEGKPSKIWTQFSPEDAVKVCKKLYCENKSVQGFLPWGVNYDAVFLWLIESGAKTEYEVAKNSNSWGNYSDDRFSVNSDGKSTGIWQEALANNIYDLAGNNWEWTQERYGENYVIRGGGYSIMGGACPGDSYPAAIRDPLSGSNRHPNIAFRSALFITGQ